MPDVYDDALTFAGGDPSVIEKIGQSDPRIAAHPKFQKLLAGVHASKARQMSASDSPGILAGTGTAIGRSLYDTAALAPGLVTEGIYSGQKGLAQGMNTIAANFQAAPANAPVDQYQGVARGLASGGGVPFDRRAEEARIGQRLQDPSYREQVAKELEYNTEMGRRGQELAAANQDVADQVGEIPSVLQGYGEGTKFIQKTGGAIGTYMIPGIGIPLGASVSAGNRMGDASVAGASPGQSLFLGAQQAALDAPLAKLGIKILPTKGAAAALAAPALGAGYAVANSGITQQFDPAAAAQERSLGNLGIAALLGSGFHSAGVYSGQRANARNERATVEAKQVEADAIADAQQASDQATARQAEINAPLDEAALAAARANDTAVQNKFDRESGSELAKVEGARRIEEHYRNREAEGDLIAEQYAKTNGLDVANFVASDRARRANSRMLGDAPVTIDPNATTQSKSVSSMVRGIRERSQPKAEEAGQSPVEPVQRAPELPGEMSPHSKTQTEQQANRLRNERLLARDVNRDRILDESADRKDQFNRDQIAERELSREAERNLVAKEQLDAEAARNAEVERDAIAQRELDAEESARTIQNEESARTTARVQQTRASKQQQVDDLYSTKLEQLQEIRERGLPKPSVQEAATQLRAWRAEQMRELATNPAHDVAQPEHANKLMNVQLDRPTLAERTNADVAVRNNNIREGAPARIVKPIEEAPKYTPEPMPEGAPNLDMMASHEGRLAKEGFEPQGASPQMIKPGMKRPALEGRKGAVIDPSDAIIEGAKAVGKGAYKVGKWISEGGIPDAVHRANMDRQGDFSARKYSLTNADGRFSKEMKRSKLSPSEILGSLKDRTILKGSKVTKEMRDLTDNMSNEAKTLGLIDPETGKIFDEREGTYTNDSFNAHDPVAGPIWEKKVPAEVRTTYANELRARGFNSKEITSIIDDALQGYKSDRSQFASVEIDTANGMKHGNLKAKQPMSDARRALLGPENNPRLVAARTVAKLNKMITDRAYAKRLLNEGYEEVFFDKASKDSTGNYNHPIQFPSFSKANEGKTYYTTKEIKDYLVERGPGTLTKFAQAVDGYTRAAKTIGAVPGFIVTQLPQNIMSTLANGHLPMMPGTVNALKGVINYLHHDARQLAGKLTPKLEAERRELIRRNVIRPHESSARLIDSISKDVHNPGYSIRSPLDVAKKGWGAARKLASMVDDLMKVNADAMQQAWVKQMHPNMTDTQVKRQSTLDIGATYYTPSEKFAGATKLGRIPGATNFITPFAELIRTPSNIVKNNIRDFVNGGKVTKAIVLGKVGALLAVAVGPSMLSALSEEQLEPNADPKVDKAEEIAAFRKAHSEYNEFDDIWLSRDEKGNIKGTNISKYNMFALPWKIVRIMRKNGVTTLDGIVKLGEAVGAPIFSPTVKGAAKVAMSFGNPSKDKWDRMKIVADVFLPTILGTAYDAMNEPDKDKTQKAFASGLFGVNTMLADPKKELRLNTMDANAKRKIESSAVSREVKTPGDALAAVMGPRRVNGDDAVDAEQAEQLADIQDTASTEKATAVKQARASGLPEEEIIRVLKNTGESPTEVGKLVLTKEQLADPVAIRIKSMLSKMDDQYGPELAVVEQITEMPKGMDKVALYNENKEAFKKGLPRYTTYKIASKILRGAGKLPPGPYRDKLMNDALKRLEKETTPSK